MKDKTIWQEVFKQREMGDHPFGSFCSISISHRTCFVFSKQTVSDFTVRALSRCSIHSRFDCIHYWCTKKHNLLLLIYPFLRQKTWLAWY